MSFDASRSRSWARSFSLKTAAALALVCGCASMGMAQPGVMAGFGHAGTIKVRVPHDQLNTSLKLGATFVADYEAFAVFEMAPAAAAQVPGSEILPDDNHILLNSVTIDTTRADVKAMETARGSFAGSVMQLVQFAGPIKPEWLDALRQTGVELVSYIPSNSYLVYGDQKALAQLQSLASVDPSIQWNGAYRDEYKYDSRTVELMQDPTRAGAKDVLFSIQLVKDADANPATLGLIGALRIGANVSEWEILNYHNVVAYIPPSSLAQVAARQDVVSIQYYVMPEKHDERQDQIVAGNLSGTGPSGPGYLAWLASKGFTQAQFNASGFAVDVSDSGIDDGTTAPNHFGLYESGNLAGTSRIIYNRLVGTAHSGSTIQGCDGHGNLNTHIVLGYDNTSGSPFADASGYHYGLGVCPFTKAGSSVIFDPSTFTSPNYPNLQSMAYHDGARISTNSWGAAVSGAYNTDAQSYDALVRDAQPSGSTYPTAGNQEMVIVFSAGNSGSGAGTIGAPGSGKNIISVGAAENVQAFGGNDGCAIGDTGADSANDIISFSSRGPCQDGRKKPDIVAPGTHVSGGVGQANPVATGTGAALSCFTGSGVCGGVSSNFFPSAGQQFYSASSGTSHSCPAVAGGAALARQFFINQGWGVPSPAMTKAMLMNSARYLNGTGANDTLYSNSQGMGEMNLGELFNRGAVTPSILRDQVAGDTFTATGQTRTFGGSITDPSKPFRVTLAWTDAPGSTSGAAYNNNLDLTVTIGANTYKGNVFSGANSITGGSADSANNVESVFLPAGTTGSFTVTVTAANINSDGVPNSGTSTDQDFALVVYNGSTAPFVALYGTGANTFTDNTGNGNNNGRIDPGETSIRVTVPISNTGNTNATSVSGTLVSNTPTVSVTSANATYPNLAAGGGTGSNSTAYVLSVSPSHPCGDPINLTLNINSAQGTGSYPFSFSTGLAGGTGSPVTFSYTGPAVAIPDNNAAGASAPLAVSGLTGTITDVNFRIDGSSCNTTAGSTTVGLDHTYLGDLTLSLTSPVGTTINLMARRGGSGNNLCQTVFDDSASTSVSALAAPGTGSFIPDSPLAAFNGQNPNGTWTFKVVDGAAADTGNIRAFSLIVTAQAPSTCSPPNNCTPVTIAGSSPGGSVCPGGSFSFNVTPAGTGPFTFQWRRNGNPVGTNSPTYSIGSASGADAGTYTCYVTNSCGNATSTGAQLTVGTTCDFNQDGAEDFADVLDLADAISSGSDPNPGCKDFNQDGGEDFADVLDMANAIASGTCP